jgi:hypothetical protein
MVLCDDPDGYVTNLIKSGAPQGQQASEAETELPAAQTQE